MVACISVPTPEDFGAEEASLHADAVEQWLLNELRLGVLEVHQAPVEEYATCEAHVVKLVYPGLVQCLPCEARVETEIVLDDDIEYVLVKVVHDNERYSSVGLTTMEEEKWPEELEFSDRIVTGTSSLHAFFASDTHTNVCFVDHCHVVCAIANSQSHFIRVPLPDHFYDVTFLFGRDSACDNDVHPVGCSKELSLEFRVLLHLSQGLASNDKSRLTRRKVFSKLSFVVHLVKQFPDPCPSNFIDHILFHILIQ